MLPVGTDISGHRSGPFPSRCSRARDAVELGSDGMERNWDLRAGEAGVGGQTTAARAVRERPWRRSGSAD